jgi:hypothetical protein
MPRPPGPREKPSASRYRLIPPALRRLLRRAERVARQPILLRQIRISDPAFRGRVKQKPGYLLVEYQTAQPGYFWDVPIIEELLRRIEAGDTTAVLRED